MWRGIATLGILRPRCWAIRSKVARSGPPPVGIFCAASVSAQRSAGEPWREMCPRRALPSELRTVGASPAQAHRCRAVGNRGDLADLGDDQHRGVAPDAADLAKHVDALVDLGTSVDLAG